MSNLAPFAPRLSSRRARTIGLLLGGIVLLGGIALTMHRTPDVPPPAVSESSLAMRSCDLNQGACSVVLGSGQHARFSITPRPVPLMQPLALRLEAPGLPPTTRVTVEFDGIDMGMGFNRTTLRPDGTGGYGGSAVLPVCATGAMRWQASVSIEGEPEPLRFPFTVAAHP